MCKFCEGKEGRTKPIHTFTFNNLKLEVFIESTGELAINTYNHEYFYVTEDIWGCFEIKFCPKCGSKVS